MDRFKEVILLEKYGGREGGGDKGKIEETEETEEEKNEWDVV